MEYSEYKELSNKIASGMHTVHVPLFMESLKLYIALENNFQKNGLREVNSDYDRGFAAACKNITAYLDKVSNEWQ